MKNHLRLSLCLILSNWAIFSATPALAQQVQGVIMDQKSNTPIPGVAVTVVNSKPINGAITDVNGQFNLTNLPKKPFKISFSLLGYKTIVMPMNSDALLKPLEIALEEDIIETSEVVVTDKKANGNVENVQMSMNRLTIQEMRRVPAIFGEVDVIKNIQQLPGVQSAGEGSSAFFVRGGSADQNLVMLDQATVYYPSHLAGIFSVFNSDVIKSADIYKGGIPAQFGGRLSSIVDIQTRDGSMKKWGGSASIGALSAKAYIEGPIVKDKVSILFAARRTYFDLFLKASPDPDLRNTQLYFYDLNGKINVKLGEKDNLYVTGYYGNDILKDPDFGIKWGNTSGSLGWNHVFNDKLFSHTAFTVVDFNYGLGLTQDAQTFDWKSYIRDYSLKQDFTYKLNDNNELKAGLLATLHEFQPGKLIPTTENSIFRKIEIPMNHGLEYAFYVSNDQKVTSRLTLQYGLRYTIFQNAGTTVYGYKDGVLDNANIVDTMHFDGLKVDKTYTGLEPRFGARFVVSKNSSIKASYNRTYQYMHMLSNSAAPIPLSLWVPSSRYIAPQYSDQIAAGYFHNLFNDQLELSVEGYYKWMNNTVDFKDNAQLLLNPTVETEVLRGKGWSYGAEFSAKKAIGKTQAAVSYTLSWTQLQIDGINNGNAYFAPWDRRHNVNVSVSHDFNERWSVGMNWTYGTGRPVTLPAAKYYFEHTSGTYYTERNGARMPDFHRLDLSVNLKSKKKPTRKWDSIWNLSIYNVYNRKNPFSVSVTNVEVADPNNADKTIATNEKQVTMRWLFPILPSISYTINF